MLGSIRLQNWKGHRDTTAPLEKLTVLVGPNGTGKSTVLDGVHLLGRMVNGEPLDKVYKGRHAPALIRRRDAVGASLLQANGVVRQQEFSVSVGFTFTQSDVPRHDEEQDAQPQSESKLQWSVEGGDPEGRREWFDWSPEAEQEEQVFFPEWLGSLACYRLNAAVIGAPASSKDRMPKVLFDGRDTAVALKAIKLGYDERWAIILDRLRKVVDNVVTVGVEQVSGLVGSVSSPSDGETNVSGEWYRIIFDFKGAKRVPGFAASEGTLVTLALITILSSPNHPNLILLDDIERGLHPTAQMELVRQLRALLDLDEMRDVQILATTHSPYILDPLDFEQVFVFALDSDGSTAVKRLSEHPDAERLRGTMSAGELWSSDPEHSWVVGN